MTLTRPSDAHTDHTRPLMLGYVRGHLLITETEVALSKELLARFAAAEGFTLGTVYVERLDTAPAAFHALIDAVKRYDVTAVAVPSPAHLSAVGVRSPLKDHLEHHTGARVLVARAT